MKEIVVLGAGLVGSLMARDLAGDPDLAVTAVDRSEEALGRLASMPRLYTKRADLSSPAEITKAVAKADVVVGAVPGFLGQQMLRTVLSAGKPLADISFAPEDPLELDGLAKEKGVPAIVDCGVSPGMSNLAAGRAASLCDALDSVQILVGGLPTRRVWPWEYRTVFSPTDVIEEYTRPARLVENGRLVTKPALSEPELFDFAEVGTLEGFLSDGLRTLLTTVKARKLEEKTLRYPGHAEKMRMLRETGFLSNESIDVGGVRVVPRALSEKLIFSSWKMPPGEEEFTILSVRCTGEKNGGGLRLTYGLLDRTDRASGATSMARTTGYPCTIAARLLAHGEFTTPGVHPPEFLGRVPRLYDALVAGLRAKGIVFTENVEQV
jgi:saccharopine dehydrogenase-like NADP-dependent oxidoreductase